MRKGWRPPRDAACVHALVNPEDEKAHSQLLRAYATMLPAGRDGRSAQPNLQTEGPMQQLIGEIMEQPQVLERLLEQEYPHMCEIAGALRGREIHQVLIAARGSSDNAATYAKYLLGARNRLPVALAAPSLYTIYGAPPRLRDTLVLGISQSGTSPDIVAVIEDARQQGMPTLAITNATASRLAAAAQWVVPLGAGEERSVAATKTYTAELMALALLSVALAADQALIEKLRAIPEAVTRLLPWPPRRCGCP